MKRYSERLKIVGETKDVFYVEYKRKKIRICKDSNYRMPGPDFNFIQVRLDTLSRQYEQAIKRQ